MTAVLHERLSLFSWPAITRVISVPARTRAAYFLTPLPLPLHFAGRQNNTGTNILYRTSFGRTPSSVSVPLLLKPPSALLGWAPKASYCIILQKITAMDSPHPSCHAEQSDIAIRPHIQSCLPIASGPIKSHHAPHTNCANIYHSQVAL